MYQEKWPLYPNGHFKRGHYIQSTLYLESVNTDIFPTTCVKRATTQRLVSWITLCRVPTETENLENESSHVTRKIGNKSWNFMISYGMLWSVMEFYQFCLWIVSNLSFLSPLKKLSSNLESPHFPTFSAKCRKCKFKKRNCHGKSRNGHGKVMEKYFVNPVGTLFWRWEYRGAGCSRLTTDRPSPDHYLTTGHLLSGPAPRQIHVVGIPTPLAVFNQLACSTCMSYSHRTISDHWRLFCNILCSNDFITFSVLTNSG